MGKERISNPMVEKVAEVVLDISMPVKDGIQATKEIRQFEHENGLPRVRIVAVTVSVLQFLFYPSVINS